MKIELQVVKLGFSCRITDIIFAWINCYGFPLLEYVILFKYREAILFLCLVMPGHVYL